jgi:hypothetical protein
VLGLAVMELLEVSVQATHPPKARKIFAGGVWAPVRTGVLIKVASRNWSVDVRRRGLGNIPPIALSAENAVLGFGITLGVLAHEPSVFVLF